MNKITVCLTGGHLSPALAVARVCRDTYPDISQIFIGREFSFDKEKGKSVEKEAMAPLVDKVYTIQTGRMTFSGLLLTVKAVISSLAILKKERPSVIVSFGGYVAVPIVIAGWLLSIPIVTHEQTRVIGKANRFIAYLAKKVCVSFPEMVGDQQRNKRIYTGLPIRKEILNAPEDEGSIVAKGSPCIYITGGTTGAVSLNDMIFPILPKLLEHVVVIHQTGNLSYPTAERIHAMMPEHNKKRYIPKAYFSSREIAWIFHHVQFVIGRSGANIVWELAALGIPAVLLPLPWSPSKEQQKNAQWLRKGGGVIVCDQQEIDSEQLFSSIMIMNTQYSVYKTKAKAFAHHIPHDGAARLLGEVIASVS